MEISLSGILKSGKRDNIDFSLIWSKVKNIITTKLSRWSLNCRCSYRAFTLNMLVSETHKGSYGSLDWNSYISVNIWGYNVKSQSLFGTDPKFLFFLRMGPVPKGFFSYGWDRSHRYLFLKVGTDPIGTFFLRLGPVPYVTFP